MMLEQYLQPWKQGPTTLYTLLRAECLPKKQMSDDVLKILTQEIEAIDLTMGQSSALALNGDNVERKRSAIEGVCPQATIDIYLFQCAMEDPFTLIECKYRKKLPTKASTIESKVVKLYEDVRKKWEKSKAFLEKEERQINDCFFLVTNATLAPVLKFHIMSYNLGVERSLPIRVVDTVELYEGLKRLGVGGL